MMKGKGTKIYQHVDPRAICLALVQTSGDVCVPRAQRCATGSTVFHTVDQAQAQFGCVAEAA